MSPKEWLAYLRQKYGYTGKFAWQKDQLDDFLARIPASEQEQARAVWMARYNKTVPEIHDELMQQYLQQITPILKPKEKEIADTTFFGILQTHEFNGYTGFTPRGDRVVVLHEGLGYTLNFWSHWYLRVLEEGGRDYLIEDPVQLYHTMRYILLFWYRGRIDTKLPDIYPKTKDSWYLSECLTMAAIAFVVGHELGHILAKHAAYGSDREQNHAMEYEADQMGLAISIRHSLLRACYVPRDNYYCKFMLYGPLFAVAVMSLFGDAASDTHPSPSDRRDHLISAYEEEMRLLLGDKFDVVVNDIDEELFDILSNNSHGLFDVFSDYRAIGNDIDIGSRKVDNTWLRSEFRTF